MDRASAAPADSVLLAISDRARGLDDPRAIVEAAVCALGRHLNAQRVGYGEVQPDGETILLETSYVDAAAPIHGLFRLDDFGPQSIAVQRTGASVAQDDVLAEPDQNHAQWAAIDTRAFASVPLLRDGRLRATLFVNFRTPHAWTAEDLSLIESVASRLWDSLERARAEDALRTSEARLALSEEALRLATEAGEVGTWDLDLTTNVLIWPPRTKAMFGLSPDAPCSMDDFYNGLHPHDRHFVTAAFDAATDPARRLPYDVEYRTIGKEDGVVRWVEARGRGIFDEQGRCVRAIGAAIDITARKAAEERLISEALAHAQDSLALIFNASAEGLTLCRLIRDEHGEVVDYQVVDVNPAHERLTGATRAQMLAKPVSQIAPPVSPQWFDTARLAVSTGAVQTFEVKSPATGIWLDVHVAPVSGDVFAQTFIDITAKRALEEQRLRFVEEMNHRVKNNFQLVSSVLDLQARRTSSVEAREQLLNAQHRITILAELHNSLAFTPGASAVDFADYLNTLCNKLRGLIDEPARIVLEVSAEPAVLDSDIAVPLGFVVNELVTNAIKYAFPAPAAGVINVSFDQEKGAYRLRVADGGKGLSAEVETKSSGLGMRLVHSFVQQVGGRLEVSHKTGVSYIVRIPVNPADTAFVL
jgi:PAS domain S-box-containing protein